ncbi:MAG: nitroreductase family deazaflavin-dependent oxidoreductase [Acidimicrobiales bacterium]|jgi:deazaflavin-dependent oxidoreductase (nitroreductase family)|nr:nitroreductase family deazaflavin-dependent oxidoreductase [Acidimicrobiales bacterium]
MGLAADLGYSYRTPNAIQRFGQAFGSTKAGAWTFSRSLRHLDRALHKLSKGRTSFPMVLAGLPVLMVTTTGRRSGEPRTTPLIAPPVGDTLALVGTNFGQKNTPAWVFNLEADPRATVEYHGKTLEVTARPATEDERADIWKTAGAIYGGYSKYQQRISGRDIRLFVLEPTDA